MSTENVESELPSAPPQSTTSEQKAEIEEAEGRITSRPCTFSPPPIAKSTRSICEERKFRQRKFILWQNRAQGENFPLVPLLNPKKTANSGSLSVDCSAKNRRV